MCNICAQLRPFDDACIYQPSWAPPPPGFGDLWFEFFDAPNFNHGRTDVGFMTANSTFDGGISFFGDSDWIRVDLEQGTTYTIQMWSYSMETFLALADNTGQVLITDTYETQVVNGISYAVSEFTVTATRTGTYYVIAEEQGNNGLGAYSVGVVEQTVSPGTQDEWTLDEIANRLTDTGWEFFGGVRRSWDKDSITYDVSKLAPVYHELADHAFDAWSKITGLSFTKVVGNADIDFDDQDEFDAYANSELKGNGAIESANINMGQSFGDRGTTLDSYTFQTFIHEIGHAIGLAHAGDYNAGQGGPTVYPDSVLFLNDSWNVTVMSYINQRENTNDGADYALVMTPMIADIIAVQSLYGVPVQAYHGDTRYGVESNTGDYMDEVFRALTDPDHTSNLITGDEPLSFTLWDTGGHDVIDFSTDTQKQKVDLRAEKESKIYGTKGAMVVGRDTEIEEYSAGSANDKITGNAGKNTLKGNSGKDTIKGMDGIDKLKGGRGNDELFGGKGKDKLNGERGDDQLTGGKKTDTFTFKSGAGQDTILDFQDDKDIVQLDEDLWTGSLNKQMVLDSFGSEKNGDVILSFDGGEKLTIVDTTLSAVKNDLEFI